MKLMKLGMAVAAFGMLVTAAIAAPKVESGLKPGEGGGAFDVVDVSGPNKGKQLCYY
jgi:hypothetical protein